MAYKRLDLGEARVTTLAVPSHSRILKQFLEIFTSVLIFYRKSIIWEIKEDKYAKSLAKNQVCAIFHMRDIRKKVLPSL